MTRLETPRLILRPPEMRDAGRIRELAGDYQVARTMLRMPHPYPEGEAEEFVNLANVALEGGDFYALMMALKETDQIIGRIGLYPTYEFGYAEMGYWAGVPYWGQGYMTEAARRMLRFAFEDLGLRRVFANCFTDNPASARVLLKTGMIHEGTLRQHYMRFGEPKDIAYYGILREEWDRLEQARG